MSNNVKVGLVFCIGIVLLLFFTVAITDIPFLQKGYSVYVRFNSASGLQKDSTVYFRGVRVGKVRSVTFDLSNSADQKIVVECYIFDEKVRIPENSIFKIESSSVLGGAQLSILLPAPKQPSEECFVDGDKADGSEAPAFIKSLSNLAGGLSGMVDENREPVKKIVSNVEKVSASMTRTDNTVGALLNERKLYDDISHTAEKIGKLADNLETGTLGKFISDPGVYEDIKHSTANLREMTDLMLSENSSIGRLLMSDTLACKLENTVGNIEKITERMERGEGLAGMLFSKGSEEIYESLQSTMSNLEKATAALNDREGSLSRMLYDNGEMFENLHDFTKSLKSVGRKLDGMDERGKKNDKPGTLAKFLDDEGKMYDTALGALDNLNEAIGGIAKMKTNMSVSYLYYPGQEYSNARLGLRIIPRPTRYLWIAGNFITPYEEGEISYDQDKIDEGHGYVFMDALLAQVFYWNNLDVDTANDVTLTLKGGLIEGKFGGAVDLDFWEHYRLSAEARFTHKEKKFNENVDNYLGRAYLSLKVFEYFRLYAGVDNFADHGEVMFGVSAEWEDKDIRSFVGLITLGQ